MVSFSFRSNPSGRHRLEIRFLSRDYRQVSTHAIWFSSSSGGGVVSEDPLDHGDRLAGLIAEEELVGIDEDAIVIHPLGCLAAEILPIMGE